ncbi:MAG: hypothetical protein P1U38_10615 [Aeromicrobium sp.]|uniref:hypothetical protein n=1 Tax=Aeromicrobium sp. TaxID=1871063 RepID=UPI0025C1DCE8|nr:hypothetical protein [Aeromicrobium sp.]MCK5891022.1 hypothetical protein [Aeromicrobium sp.]MDF1705216.1 hypothetical protein [Aeromicrobium sp.]
MTDVRGVEAWFDDHGLPYFVVGQAETVEGWLSSRRIVALLVVLVGLGVGVGIAVARTIGGASDGVLAGAGTFVVLLALYAGRLLRMGTMVRWAVRRTFGSLGLLLPLLSRALPLLLLAVTFLFINAEVWQVAALMSRTVLWLSAGAFALVAAAFLLVRLPEEVAAVEREVVGDRLAERCAGTPALDLLGTTDVRVGELPRFARANLVLVLLFSQAVQVLLLTAGLFAFFVVFGSLTIPPETIESWTGHPVSDLPSRLGGHLPLTNDLFQVAVFLAAFSGLYFTVYAVTDDTYRRQFFTGVSAQLERAVAVHAVYRAARDTSDT